MSASEILTQGIVNFMEAGGNPAIYALALIGLFSILIGAFEKGGKYILMIIYFVIAAPIIFYQDYKTKVKLNQPLDSQDTDGRKIYK